MPVTYEPIQTVTPTSNTATITFSNIPQTYSDLKLVIRAFGTNDSANCAIRYNGVTSGYANTQLISSGSSLTFQQQSSTNYMYLTVGGNLRTGRPLISTIDILEYTLSSKKTSLSRSFNYFASGEPDRGMVIHTLTTGAITSITVNEINGYAYTANATTVTLLGIKRA